MDCQYPGMIQEYIKATLRLIASMLNITTPPAPPIGAWVIDTSDNEVADNNILKLLPPYNFRAN